MAMTLNDRKYSSYILDNSPASTANVSTPYGVISAGKYFATYTNLTDGDYGFLRLTTDGKLMVDTELTLDGNVMIDNIAVWATNIADSSTAGFALIDAAGHPQVDVLTMPGGLTGYAEDTAHVTGDIGVLSLAVRNDTPSALAGASGDYIPFTTDSDGRLWVRLPEVAHDAADSGNPIKVGARARTSQITAVSNNDRTDLITDQYGQLVIKGTDWTTDSVRTSEIDPISSHHVEETLVATTGLAIGTYYYYIDMDGFKTLNNQVVKAGAGTMACTVEGTLQDDGTAPASCTYSDVTTDLYGIASISASDIFVDDTGACAGFKYLRVKVVVTVNTIDLTIWSKKVY
jgi:hypothetical protein